MSNFHVKEKYEEFKSTKEYNTLQEKCKADFAKWKAGSDSDEAPKKKTAEKKTAEVTSDSDDDDDTFTMSKPKVVPEKVPKKTQPKKEKNKKAAKVDSDDDE
jgi:hypothetical protein